MLAVACIVPSTYILARKCASKCKRSTRSSLLCFLLFYCLQLLSNLRILIDFASKQDEKEIFFQQLEEEMNVRHISDAFANQHCSTLFALLTPFFSVIMDHL